MPKRLRQYKKHTRVKPKGPTFTFVQPTPSESFCDYTWDRRDKWLTSAGGDPNTISQAFEHVRGMYCSKCVHRMTHRFLGCVGLPITFTEMK